MLKSIKFISLVVLLISSITMAGCSSVNESDDNQSRLVAKITEEQNLIKTFRKNFSFDQGREFEENLAKAKTNYTSQEWEAEIIEVEELKKELELSQDSKSDLANYDKAKAIIQRLIPDLTVADFKQDKINPVIYNYLAILYNVREQNALLTGVK